MKHHHFSGLIAATFTPMNADGGVNIDMIDKHAEMMVNDGLDGVFVCGSTGESVSLTVGERMAVAERWKAVAGGKLPIMVHVGGTCLIDCRTLAEHAQKTGVDAVSSMAPSFFKPANVDDLVAFCAEIAAAAPDLPFYFYHMPARTGVNLPMVQFIKAAAEKIPNLAGIKFTSEDLMDFGRCLSFNGKINMLYGRDEMLLAALALGARGAVGTTFSIVAPLYRRIITAYQNGDMAEAQAQQARSRDIIAVIFRHGGLPAFKAVMKMLGVDCGPARLPLRNITIEQYNSLKAELDRIGFFEFRK